MLNLFFSLWWWLPVQGLARPLCHLIRDPCLPSSADQGDLNCHKKFSECFKVFYTSFSPSHRSQGASYGRLRSTKSTNSPAVKDWSSTPPQELWTARECLGQKGEWQLLSRSPQPLWGHNYLNLVLISEVFSLGTFERRKLNYCFGKSKSRYLKSNLICRRTLSSCQTSMTVSTNMSQWLSEAGCWAGQISGMKWRFLCCCFLQTGVPSPAVFSSCYLLLLYTASKNTFRSAASAFSCWVYNGHGVGNVHSILPNYFTDLYASPHHE